MTTLYQLSAELDEQMTALGELLESGGTPSDDELYALLKLQDDLQNKLVNYGKFIKNTEGDIDAIDGEIKRLTAKKKSLTNRNEHLKNTMLLAMSEHNLTVINDPIMPIKLKTNPPAVKIDVSVDKLPSEFVKTKIEADKTALSKALKAGALIDGVSLVQAQSIKIGG